jgi:hypothetical protein
MIGAVDTFVVGPRASLSATTAGVRPTTSYAGGVRRDRALMAAMGVSREAFEEQAAEPHAGLTAGAA